MDPMLNSHRHGLSFANTPRPRPRPRSLHELPSYHVEMPLLPFDQVQNMGPWTPGAPFTTDGRSLLVAPPLSLMDSNMYQMEPFERGSRSPGYTSAFDVAAEYGERARSTSRTPSRRHTLESSAGLFAASSAPMHGYGESSARPLENGHHAHDPRAGYFGLDDPRRFPGWSNPHVFASEANQTTCSGSILQESWGRKHVIPTASTRLQRLRCESRSDHGNNTRQSVWESTSLQVQ